MGTPKYIDFLAKLKLSHAHPGGMALTDHLLKNLKLKKDDHVLDIGCGTGATAALIRSQYGSEVTAADFHAKMVQAASERAALMKNPFTVIKADAENLPFNDAMFDVILSESVSAFTQLSHSLPEYYRVLKNNGYWVGIEMTSNTKLSPNEIQRIKDFYGVREVLTEQEWLIYLRVTGFTDIRVETGPLLVPAQSQEGYMMPLEYMTSEDMAIWWTHLSFMEKMKDILSYRVYIAKKPI